MDAELPANETQSTTTGVSPIKLLLGCGGCLVLVVGFFALIAGGVYTLTKPAADATHLHWNTVKAGDLDGAYQALSASLQGEFTREQFGEFVDSLPQLYAADDLTLNSRHRENDTADMSGHATTSSLWRTVSFGLIEVDGVWKISRITLGE